MISAQSIHPRITLQMLHPSFNWIADTASQNLTWRLLSLHHISANSSTFLQIFQSTHLYAGAKTQKELHLTEDSERHVLLVDLC